MSAIDGIYGGGNIIDGTSKTTKEDAMGRDAFLQLLVTQLENQNPLEPQADGEFLAQLAQFSSLEQLQSMQKDLSTLVAYVETALAQSSESTTQGSN